MDHIERVVSFDGSEIAGNSENSPQPPPSCCLDK